MTRLEPLQPARLRAGGVFDSDAVGAVRQFNAHRCAENRIFFANFKTRSLKRSVRSRSLNLENLQIQRVENDLRHFAVEAFEKQNSRTLQGSFLERHT